MGCAGNQLRISLGSVWGPLGVRRGQFGVHWQSLGGSLGGKTLVTARVLVGDPFGSPLGVL